MELDDTDESIFSVKFQKISSELEINESSLKCITGDTVHFDIPISNLRTFMQTKPHSILLNFYQNDELFQATITSKHCISIIKFLESIT